MNAFVQATVKSPRQGILFWDARSLEEAIVETRQIHARIDVFLLGGIDDATLADKAGGSNRTVADGFAHIHKVPARKYVLR